MTSHRIRSTSHYQLLEVDPAFETGIPLSERDEAARLIAVPAVHLGPGDSAGPDDLIRANVTGAIRGFLIVSGVLIAGIELADRRSLRLAGYGDVVLFGEAPCDSRETTFSWTSLNRCDLALLDTRFIWCCRRWPSLFDAILSRSARYAQDFAKQQAISQLPHVEDPPRPVLVPRRPRGQGGT